MKRCAISPRALDQLEMVGWIKWKRPGPRCFGTGCHQAEKILRPGLTRALIDPLCELKGY
jgi:hypothetical protein